MTGATYCMNLSAPFLMQVPPFKAVFVKTIPLVDFLFGNETEALTWAETEGWDTKDVGFIATRLSLIPSDKGKKRYVVITQGADSTLVAHNGLVTEHPILKLDKSKIVDTNGAGDAYVGGFLAGLAKGKDIKGCHEAGAYSASVIIQQSGCVCPGKPDHKWGTFLFSSESVNEGHPDKLADQVSDAVLDACLKEDPKSKVACETATKDNMVMVFGEITTAAKLDYDSIVRQAVRGIGYDSFVDDLDSVVSKGMSDKSCEVLVRINKQSPDIAGGVHVGKDELDVGAGDQGIMFGYASDETEDCMPLTILIATRLGKKLTDVRKDGLLWWLRPDGKTQVTIEYLQHKDGTVEPLKIHTIVISTQHAEPKKAKRSEEVAGWNGAEAIAPSMSDMNDLIVKEVIETCLSEIKLKN